MNCAKSSGSGLCRDLKQSVDSVSSAWYLLCRTPLALGVACSKYVRRRNAGWSAPPQCDSSVETISQSLLHAAAAEPFSQRVVPDCRLSVMHLRGDGTRPVTTAPLWHGAHPTPACRLRQGSSLNSICPLRPWHLAALPHPTLPLSSGCALTVPATGPGHLPSSCTQPSSIRHLQRGCLRPGTRVRKTQFA
jgi:hypothetical protein